jgi:coenzyme PQQ precursor peptide PqqA
VFDRIARRRVKSRHGGRPPILEEMDMAWKKPRVTEICLALEINGYVSATL